MESFTPNVKTPVISVDDEESAEPIKEISISFEKENGETDVPTEEEERRSLIAPMFQRTEIQRPTGAERIYRTPEEPGPTEDERGLVEKRLPEDTFSLTMINPVNSLTFWFGMGTSCFQFLTYTLVIIDVIDTSNQHNPFDFPANVDIAVRISQVIALVILIPLQDEILEFLVLTSDGYKNETFAEKFPFASRKKYLISLFLRLSVGCLSIFTSFILIMIESTVLDIFFNFIALQFINDLDNLAFRLGSEGILGKKLQLGCNDVSDTSYYTENKFRRKLPLVFIFLLVLGGWVWILYLQLTGKFVTESIEVQMGDDINPVLSLFSGIYDRGDSPIRDHGRFNYIDRKSKRAFFGYCAEIEAWTFSYSGSSNPCEDYAALSETTSTYEITQTTLWKVVTTSDQEVPLEPMYLACFACSDQSNPCQNGGHYHSNSKTCVCPVDRFGRRCEFALPCSDVTLDDTDSDFVPASEFPLDYTAVKDSDGQFATIYDKPVYADSKNQIVIFFSGRRWLVSSPQQLGGGEQTTLDSLADLVQENDFHFYYSQVPATIISDPSDIGSPSDSATPVGNLGWYRTSSPAFGFQVPVLNEQIPTHFDCRTCDDSQYICLYGNPCVDGTCVCLDGSSGVTCNVIPYENGHCDVEFNLFDFSYDRGDCCRASCTSTDEFYCGYEGRIEIGFPNCIDESYTCVGNQTCWVREASDFVLPKPRGALKAPKSSAALSPNGRILVAGYPELDTVQVMDHVDSSWIVRNGQTLGGVPTGSSFGAAVAMATVDGSILDLISTTVEPSIAVGMTTSTVDAIRLYKWNFDRFEQSGSDIQLLEGFSSSGFFPTFDFFSAGEYLASQASGDLVHVYHAQNTSELFASLSCVGIGLVCNENFLIFISENGEFLLRATTNAPVGDIVLVAPSAGYNTTGSFQWLIYPIPSGGTLWSTLSRNGLVVSYAKLAENQETFVYFQERSNGVWEAIGNPIVVPKGWMFHRSGILSHDGKRAALVFCRLEAQDTCVARIYQSTKYNDYSTWEELGNDIEVSPNPSLSFSTSTSVLVVADSSGVIRTFSYSAKCESGQSYYRLYTLLEQGQHLAWSLLVQGSGEVHASPAYSSSTSQKILHEICVPKDSCSELTVATNQEEVFLSSLLSLIIDNQEELNRSPITSGKFLLGNCDA